MRPKDHELANTIGEGLRVFDQGHRRLPGIDDPAHREALIEQMLESNHRVRIISVMKARDISGRRADPSDELFDPLKAAILNQRQGNIDEACWMVFLFVHFGKHAKKGYKLARQVYLRDGGPSKWDWASVSISPSEFRNWLAAHQSELQRDGPPDGFGNHRKYQSLDAKSKNGTGDAVETYVNWINPP